MFNHELRHQETIERIASLELILAHQSRILSQLELMLKKQDHDETPRLDIPARNSVRQAEMYARTAKNVERMKIREQLRGLNR